MARKEHRLTLDGLTKRQVALLDVIWGIDSREELIAFRSTLPEEIKTELDTLVQLIIYESMEDDIMEMKSYPDAERMINDLKG